jgi:hypothetical protein
MVKKEKEREMLTLTRTGRIRMYMHKRLQAQRPLIFYSVDESYIVYLIR